MNVASVSSRDGDSEFPLSVLTRNSLLQCRFAQETSPLLASYDIPDVGVTDTEHRVVSARTTARGVSMTPSHPSMRLPAEGQRLDEVGAGDEIRTRDIQLGRLELYH
jgi:hypothetical protein